MIAKPDPNTLNALDYLPPPCYSSFFFYLPLKSNANPKDAFKLLQEGLQRTFIQLPWMNGVMERNPCNSTELRMRARPLESDGSSPRQLRYSELHPAKTYEDLQECGLHPNVYDDDSLCWVPWLPDIANCPDVFVAQANFLQGGCLLSSAICHSVTDGTGQISIMRIWADNCRDIQLGVPLGKELPPEIADRSLMERVCAEEGSGRSWRDIPLDYWRLLNIEPPKECQPPPQASEEPQAVQAPAPVPDCPATPKPLRACIFYMSPANIKALRERCIHECNETDISINDVICALIWRSVLKSRVAVKEAALRKITGEHHAAFPIDAQTRLDLPFDVRPYFPEYLHPDYMGNCTMVNQAILPLSEVVSPTTSIANIAQSIRQVINDATPERMADAYTLAKALPDLEKGPPLSNLAIDGTGLIITSLLALPLGDICFGDEFFAGKGMPEAMRPAMGMINEAFRYSAIFPKRSHGGVEWVANMSEDELKVLMEDEEFGKYAYFLA